MTRHERDGDRQTEAEGRIEIIEARQPRERRKREEGESKKREGDDIQVMRKEKHELN